MTARRNTIGTPDHLWARWVKKLYNSYEHYANHGTGEPPSHMRAEFCRDVERVVEYRIAEIFPDRTTLTVDE